LHFDWRKYGGYCIGRMATTFGLNDFSEVTVAGTHYVKSRRKKFLFNSPVVRATNLDLFESAIWAFCGLS